MPKKYQVEITQKAEDDLEAIWQYIAKNNPINADRLVSRLEIQTTTLESFPKRGVLIPENNIFGTDYRQLIHKDYRTIYKISGSKVFVMRVVHGSRLLKVC